MRRLPGRPKILELYEYKRERLSFRGKRPDLAVEKSSLLVRGGRRRHLISPGAEKFVSPVRHLGVVVIVRSFQECELAILHVKRSPYSFSLQGHCDRELCAACVQNC